MGRPIQKKYFGNTNVPAIGGEGVASISVATVGSFVVNDTYRNFPLLNIGAPNLPTGVQATADVVFEIDTVTYASGGQTDGDYVAGLSTSIVGLGGGAVVNIVETTNKVTSVNLTGGNRGEFRRGDITGAGITTFQVLQAPNAGTDLQINVTFRVKSITIVEAGSGYTAAPILSWSGHTFTGQTTPSGQTPTLTSVKQNAITMTGRVVAGGTVALDVIKQTGSRRYRVTDGTNAGVVKLVGAAVAAAGEAQIVATDSAGGTYYVTKITAHRAVVTPGTGTQFTAGTSVPWTFGTATQDVSVKIPNA